MPFLYENLEVAKKLSGPVPLPPLLVANLSPRIALRDYQVDAFGSFLTYWDSKPLRGGNQPHLLFHMATGSGKTVIMAGLMLYLYSQGYRNFLFFVNSSNVLAKTRENFCNPLSSKYLFAPQLELDGQRVRIRSVDSFSPSSGKDIQLCFTTIQKLHLDLLAPRENGLSLEDFSRGKVALLSDEAHHVNTLTKSGKTEAEAQQSWETSVRRAFHAHEDNLLLEFTATCDLKDPNVLGKYTDKLLFHYPLSNFRASGYTKEFQNLQTGHDPWGRTLTALVLSQYRLMLFGDAHQAIKPVVLLKSQRIAESEAFYQAFFPRLAALTGADLEALDFSHNPALTACQSYLDANGMTLDMLAQALRLAFPKERSLLINGKADHSEAIQLALNTLEEPSNPYRLIFTVDMLNEGWDVLNLFDIVRLYETRQSSGRTISPYTMQEAQLIGRGARYCPFLAQGGQNRFRRKYDEDAANPMRVCETLYYHSKDNSRYIDELRHALTQLGLLAPSRVEVTCTLKPAFQATDLFLHGLLFSNRREEAATEVAALAAGIRSLSVSVHTAGEAVVYDLFSPHRQEGASPVYRHAIPLAQVPWSIALDALCHFEPLRFDRLKARFPTLSGVREFVTHATYLGAVILNLSTPAPTPSGADLHAACLAAFAQVAGQVTAMEPTYRGTTCFFPHPLREVVTQKVRILEDPHGDGEGISQTHVSPALRLDLSTCHWYPFEDHFGTTEEKAFVFWFSHQVAALEKIYPQVFLLRNERFPLLALYDWDTGDRFEPDFVLLLGGPSPTGGTLWRQIFIEPKGEGFRATDAWKETLLLRLETHVCPLFPGDGNEYRLSGLPFFTQGDNTPFLNAFQSLLKK